MNFCGVDCCSVFFIVCLKSDIFIGVANLVKLLVTIASPLSSDAIVLSSSLRSCDALSMIACRSSFISVPRIILVFMFASTCRGMSEGNCVTAQRPMLNFLPSRAIVLKMFCPCSRTSLPRTRGASSRMIAIAGRSWRVAMFFFCSRSVS